MNPLVLELVRAQELGLVLGQALGLEPLALRAVTATLAALTLPEVGFQLVVMGCDNARIATLNADFRGKPQPTNVLSWPAEELAAEHHAHRDQGGRPALVAEQRAAR